MSTDIAITLRAHVQEIISRRQDVVLLAAQGRSKFEQWLKFELAVVLSQSAAFQSVKVEDGYAGVRDRSDISFQADGIKWHVELKTANTNWRDSAVETKGCPITMNIDAIIGDIRKLRRCCGSSGVRG